jgi:hypothetical protein
VAAAGQVFGDELNLDRRWMPIDRLDRGSDAVADAGAVIC